jgi:hypothetical protein
MKKLLFKITSWYEAIRSRIRLGLYLDSIEVPNQFSGGTHTLSIVCRDGKTRTRRCRRSAYPEIGSIDNINDWQYYIAILSDYEYSAIARRKDYYNYRSMVDQAQNILNS